MSRCKEIPQFVICVLCTERLTRKSRGQVYLWLMKTEQSGKAIGKKSKAGAGDKRPQVCVSIAVIEDHHQQPHGEERVYLASISKSIYGRQRPWRNTAYWLFPLWLAQMASLSNPGPPAPGMKPPMWAGPFHINH